MTNEEIVKNLSGHEHEIKNLGYRIGNLEAVSKQINDLALSVQKLALNMARMLDEQKILSEEQKIISGRVRNLEDKPGQTWGAIVQTAITAIVSALAGGIAVWVVQGLALHMH
ncbi:MAG: hypothetical protein ACFN2Z_04030 [Oribacterium sp.]|uniref:hypothetical protein n=1 Tax=Oribacterium sp. oral taxon 078 TaxID=652706 RepID=UPI00041E5B9D|nr:hypothetical protein [Oribacterium sp. oral taxon 078]